MLDRFFYLPPAFTVALEALKGVQRCGGGSGVGGSKSNNPSPLMSTFSGALVLIRFNLQKIGLDGIPLFFSSADLCLKSGEEDAHQELLKSSRRMPKSSIVPPGTVLLVPGHWLHGEITSMTTKQR